MIETDPSATAALAPPGPTSLAGELAEAVVDHGAIAANVRALRATAGTRLMAVVKADAFGHGAVPVARTCLAAGASWLGVTRVGEALELRRVGITAPVLAWLFEPSRAEEAVAADVDLSVSSPGDLAAVARATGRPRLHLKLDTGLHRSGCPGEDWSGLVSAAAALESAGRVRVVGLWSHLSHGGEPDAVATHRQLLMFRVGVDLARVAGLRPEVVHLANTAAVQANSRHTAYDLVRVGAGIYGIGDGLSPALTLRTRVVQVRRVATGRGVGYDHVGRTTRDTHLALVPLGYADGIPRHASGGGAEVLIGGRRRPVVGRIAMDQFVVDVGDDPVSVGDEVVVFGDPATGAPTADEWAAASGTIGYEIVTRIGPRVGRTYVGATPAGGSA